MYLNAALLDDLDPPFVLLGRSGYYYIAVGAAGVVGAVVAHVQRAQVVRITTSVLGGGGVALVTHLVVVREGGAAVPDVALLVVLLVCTVVGVAVQTRLAKKKRPRSAIYEKP